MVLSSRGAHESYYVSYSPEQRSGERAEGQIGAARPDMFARVATVALDGTALPIAREQLQVADAATPTQIEIDLGQVSCRVETGHRIRVRLSSSDHSEFIPRSGIGEGSWSAVGARTNGQHVEVLSVTLSILDAERNLA